MPRKSSSRSPGRPRAVEEPNAADAAPLRAPIFGVLDRAGCEALLARQRVGRLAFAFHDRVDIEPIHYAYEDGWLYGRTSHGSKLATVLHNPWVAFEVDEVRSHFDWESVV